MSGEELPPMLLLLLHRRQVPDRDPRGPGAYQCWSHREEAAQDPPPGVAPEPRGAGPDRHLGDQPGLLSGQLQGGERLLQGSGQEVEPQWGGEGVPEAMAGQQGGLPGEEGHLPTGGEVLQAEVEGPLAGEEVHQELAAPGAGGDHQVLPGGGGHREHITLPERATGRGETGCSSGPTAGRGTWRT